jgi:transcription elongation factor Elf1
VFFPPDCEPVETAFTCLFCHHDKSVTVRLDRKEGVAQLVCRICDQRYQGKVNRMSPVYLSPLKPPHYLDVSYPDLTEPIDIYSEWIDAADAVQRDQVVRRPAASSSRPVPSAPSVGSDDE